MRFCYMSNRDTVIVQKILSYCRQIQETHLFFHDDQELFLSEEAGFVYRNSISMPILQIGELAKRLSEEFRKEHHTIPWRAIAGMRDIFAHHYGSVDNMELWQTSHVDIESLITNLEN